MKIGICSDHAGYDYKTQLITYLQSKGIEMKDLGTGDVDLGIAMCGTGNGMAMTLNKHQGIRAGLAWDVEIGKLVKQHNNANVLVMPARFIPFDMVCRITDAWLGTEFEGGRHQKRIDKIPVK